MFWSAAKLPITEDDRLWVEEGFRRLSNTLGRRRMLECAMVLPSDEFFPDAYTPSEAGLRALFVRTCGFMGLDPNQINLQILPDSSDLFEQLPEFRHSTSDPAGIYFGSDGHGSSFVGVRQSQLKDPLSAVATLAHELAHVILLGEGHLSRDVKDMEPMTDLATVFLGFGVFTSNSARRFVQSQEELRYRWSMSHQGYLPEEVYAYALAFFAKERGEEKPGWVGYLSTNLKTFFRQSQAWLKRRSVE